MKKLLLAAVAALALSAPAQAQNVEPRTFQLSIDCYPSKFFLEQMGEFRVMTSFEHENPQGHKLVDAMIYSKTQDAIFIVRDNEHVKYTCIFTVFDEISKAKTPVPEKKQEPKKDTKPKNNKQV